MHHKLYPSSLTPLMGIGHRESRDKVTLQLRWYHHPSQPRFGTLPIEWPGKHTGGQSAFKIEMDDTNGQCPNHSYA